MEKTIEHRISEIEANLDTILLAIDPKNVANQELLKEVRSLCAPAEIRDHKRRHANDAKNEYETLKLRVKELEQDYNFINTPKQ